MTTFKASAFQGSIDAINSYKVTGNLVGYKLSLGLPVPNTLISVEIIVNDQADYIIQAFGVQGESVNDVAAKMTSWLNEPDQNTIDILDLGFIFNPALNQFIAVIVYTTSDDDVTYTVESEEGDNLITQATKFASDLTNTEQEVVEFGFAYNSTEFIWSSLAIVKAAH